METRNKREGWEDVEKQAWSFPQIEAERVLRRREISPVGMQRRMDRGSSDHEQMEWV